MVVRMKLSEHLSSIITIAVIVVGNVIGYAKLVFKVADYGDRLKKLESEFDDHEKSNSLHRTPDFELRLNQFGSTLDEIRADVKKLLHLDR